MPRAQMTRRQRIQAYDLRLLRRIVRVRRKPVLLMVKILCRFFDPDMAAGGVAVALYCGGVTAQLANHAGIALIATTGFVSIVKRIVRRERPMLEMHALAPPDRFSFPSGHTSAAFSLAIAMSTVSPIATYALLCVAAFVGYGRMYLGVHYPIDVACGALIGSLTGLAVALSA